MSNIEQANATLNRAGIAVRNLVQQAYDAGTTSNLERAKGEGISKPAAEEVNAALAAFDRAAVGLAHARMEEVAKRCGFEGLTEALGYLQTLRTNPLAELLREAVNLAIAGDITESEDAAEFAGWGNWLLRAKAAVGDKAPPEFEALGEGSLPAAYAHETALDRLEVEAAPFMKPRPVGMLPALGAPYDTAAGEEAQERLFKKHFDPARYAKEYEAKPEPQVLSGCAVRAAIQVDNTMPEGFVPTASALRGRDGFGKWVAANRHDMLYSMVTIIATEFFDGEKWVPVAEGEGNGS